MEYKRTMEEFWEQQGAKVLSESGNKQAPSSSSVNVPSTMEGLHERVPPPFLMKIFKMVEDPSLDHLISWSKARNSFIIWDSHQFTVSLLPTSFKHNNFSNFVRQLNNYGFKKVDPDRWEFAHEGFLGGQKHLLMTIKSRRNVSHGVQPKAGGEPCVELGNYGIEGDLERLRRDKNMLMTEVVKLRQQQQESDNSITEMENKIHEMESKQRHLMDIFYKAINDPAFIQQYMEMHGMTTMDPHKIEIGRKRRPALGPAGGDNFQDQASFDDDIKSILSAVAAVDNNLSDNISLPKAPAADDIFYDNMWGDLIKIMDDEGVEVGDQPAGVEVDNVAKSLGWDIKELEDLINQPGGLSKQSGW